MRESRRYLGIELSGARNDKTAVAAIDFYLRERKVFVLDLFEKVVATDEQSSDEALLDVIHELGPRIAAIGVNVPLSLPPCIECTRAHCPMPAKCTVPAVKWMRTLANRKAKTPKDRARAANLTPYTQRPVELWIRQQILPTLPNGHEFEIDEALGGNKAPLTARMQFLTRHLKELPILEIQPKLSVSVLAADLNLPKRWVEKYRNLEEGAQARSEIIDALSRGYGLFIYERDAQKLSQSLSAFDALICAYTAALSDQGASVRPPTGFPAQSGWISFPKKSP